MALDQTGGTTDLLTLHGFISSYFSFRYIFYTDKNIKINDIYL